MPTCLYVLRDPRAVITSRHKANPKIYACNYRIWKRCELASSEFQQHPRFLQIRYEDLVRAPDECQRHIRRHVGFLRQTHRFAEFQQVATPHRDSLQAMNGLRPVSSDSIKKWKEHLPRVKHQLLLHPELNDDLIRLEYESTPLKLSLSPSCEQLCGRHVWRALGRAALRLRLLRTTGMFAKSL